MTDEELMALPDVSPRQEYIDAIQGGEWIRIPAAVTDMSRFFEPDVGAARVDAGGYQWELGRINGVMVRRKAVDQSSADTNP